MPHRRRIPAWLLLVPALCAWIVAAGAEESAAPRGMVIYRDPATGRLAAPPPGVVPPVPGLPRQAGPIAETPGTTRAGGWKASGRFTNTMQATVGPDGTLAVDCVPKRSGETD